MPEQYLNNKSIEYKRKALIYDNPLNKQEDLDKFRIEGVANTTIVDGMLQIENVLEPDYKDDKVQQKANIVYWCPEEFPENILVEWNFIPVREPGLCIFFFAAKGRNGEDVFDSSLNPRRGLYEQYHHGDINAFHAAYFRRHSQERAFNVCNLRKSYGFHLVAQGADPIPTVKDCVGSYKIAVVKFKGIVQFFINDLLIYTYEDDGTTYGPVLGGGKIGFRQMAPMIARYGNLKVYELE